MPGVREPSLTPYIIAFERAVQGRTHKRVVMVISAQSGKTEALLDILGERFDTSPVPTLYVGPSKQFLTEQFEPRITELIDQAPALARKVLRGRRAKITKKVISGVPLRLAHGGSSSALKSDPFGLAFTDEADELMANVRNAGNPIDLVDIRGDTYADFVHAIVSTPSEGPSEVERDEESGLEFWAEVDQEAIKSTIWSLWQSGTRYHWAWPCPHCGEYFIPRFQNMRWEKPIDPITGKEKSSDPVMARKTAYMACPRNGCIIHNESKEEMNARGVYVAPGQSVTPDGIVEGEPPDSWTLSYWVSGLASPFKTWGERVERYVNAVRSGKPDSIRAVINGGFGELYTPGGGAVPAWEAVQGLASKTYVLGQVPGGAKILTMACDVQKYGIYWTIRAWGHRGTSWLVNRGYLQGDTADDAIWEDLSTMVQDHYDGLPIKMAFIDSGYRPGKKDEVPIHRVYEFARKHRSNVRAAKGLSSKPTRPLVLAPIDINVRGQVMANAIDLARLDPDHWKSWVHERIGFDLEQPGAWHLPEDIDEDYCRQIVSEARIRKPSGQAVWVQKQKDNHYLDCESMQAALGSMLNVLQLREGTVVHRHHPDDEVVAKAKPKPAGRGGGFLGNSGSIW